MEKELDLPGLKETCKIIRKWVDSCTTLDQIKLTKEAVNKLVIDRFCKEKDVLFESCSLGVYIHHKERDFVEVDLLSGH